MGNQICAAHRQRATNSCSATVFSDLPECIIIEEILVRLPSKDLLRCRAVCKLWRTATSTDNFLLDHCHRQPSLPVFSARKDRHLVFREDVAGAPRGTVFPLIRCAHTIHGACDGLLVVYVGNVLPRQRVYICNPKTRKSARLPNPRVRPDLPVDTLSVDYIVGFYRHQPSGEYRVLWASPPFKDGDTADYYVLTVGSNNPRCIGRPPMSTALSPSVQQALRRGLPRSSSFPPVYHRGSLHWELGRHSEVVCDIMVFDIVAETFRWMHRPARLGWWVSLLKMNGTLALCSHSINAGVTVDVWVMQDYETEVWAFKHRISSEAIKASPPLKSGLSEIFHCMVLLNERDPLLELPGGRVFRCDIHGKFLGYLKGIIFCTHHCYQESIIPLPQVGEMQEEDDAGEEPPFFVGL